MVEVGCWFLHSETKGYVSMEQFSEMFRMRYVPLVERERLAEEYFDLR